MSDLRDFRFDVPEEALDDLKRRLAATRWPDRETPDDWSQGIPLAYVQDVCAYWQNEYDWRRCEAALNALPQFITEIDGLDFQFLHVRSPCEDALPLVMTHGWPGSVIEFLKVIGPCPTRKPTAVTRAMPFTSSVRPCPALVIPVSRMPPAGLYNASAALGGN